MVQQLVHAQQLIRGTIQPLKAGERGPSSNAATATDATGLQAELLATQSRLVRALSALEKLQADHARQRQLISDLEQQVYHLQAHQPADTEASTTDTLIPGVAAVPNGATSMQLHAQQQDLAGRLAAKEQAEQQLQRELNAKQQQLMGLEGKMNAKLSALQDTIKQQASKLADLTQQLLNSQMELANSRLDCTETQKRLKHREAELSLQVQQVDNLLDALAQAKKGSSQMQWQLLSKEAALGSLKQQLADTKETAHQAGAAQEAQLQQKDVTINTLLEKLSMLEAASAAEVAWLQDKVNNSQQQTAELQVEVQQRRQDLRQQSQLQQQPASHGAILSGELSSEITSLLQHAVLSCLLGQLSDIRTAYQIDLQALQQRLAQAPAVEVAEVAGNNSQAVAEPQQTDAQVTDTVILGDQVTGSMQQLQQIVADNIKLVEQLASMAALMSPESQQPAAVEAQKDKLLLQQANQLREVGVQQLEQHLASLTIEVSALSSQLMGQQQELRSKLSQQLEQHLAPLVAAVTDCRVAILQLQQRQDVHDFGTNGAADLQHIAQQLSALAADVSEIGADVQDLKYGMQLQYAQVTTTNTAAMQQLTEDLQQETSELANSSFKPAVLGQCLRSTEEIFKPVVEQQQQQQQQRQTGSVEATVVEQQQQQQLRAELHQMAVELELVRNSESKLQQQLQQLHVQHQQKVQQAASTYASGSAGKLAELEAKYKQQVVENAVLQDKQQQQSAELRHMAVELQLFRSSESSMQQRLQQQEQAHRQEQNILQQKLQQLQHLQQQLREHELLMEASERDSDDGYNSSGSDLTEYVMGSSQPEAHIGFKGDKDITVNIHDLTINMHEHLVADDNPAAASPSSTVSSSRVNYPLSPSATAVEPPTPGSTTGNEIIGTMDDDVTGSSELTDGSDSLHLLQQMAVVVDSRNATIMQLQQQISDIYNKSAKDPTQSQDEYPGPEKEAAHTSDLVDGSPQLADAANGAQFDEPDISSSAPITQMATAMAAAATATVTVGIPSASNGTDLLGSGLSLALLLPLMNELHRAQKAEAAVQAAKHKLCAAINLLGATELSITLQHKQALALQQHMWKVAAWKPLLIQVWQLHETEEALAADLALLQQLEEQHAGQQLIEQLARVDDLILVSQDDEDGQHQQLNNRELQLLGNQVQQQVDTSRHGVMLAELVGWEGDSVVASSLTKINDKVGQLLVRLADRQVELARGRSHVRRLAGVLMSGTGVGLVEVQQQQLERSRRGVGQQLIDFQELQT